MISSIAAKDNPQGNTNNVDTFDEMEVVPSTVTVEMIRNWQWRSADARCRPQSIDY